MNPISVSIAASIPSSTSPTAHSPSKANGPGWDSLVNLIQKRIKMVNYVLNVSTSKSLYFNTTRITTKDIKSALDVSVMKRRALNFFCLGLSLSQLLSTHFPSTFIRSLSVLIQEFEYENNESHSQRLSKIRKKKQVSKDESDNYYLLANFMETGVYSQLMTPNIPFELDYFEVFQSFMQVLADIYAKFYQWLPQSKQAQSNSDNLIPNEYLYFDAVYKIDHKFMKFITPFMKELDVIAKKSSSDALASVDPLIYLRKDVEDKDDDDIDTSDSRTMSMISAPSSID